MLKSDVLKKYIHNQENKTLLRFITCGSVDDGKSTLIGRLLYETKLLFDDQLAALEKDSKKHGTAGRDIDYALLLDGLDAEREQGITIDVAYRFFDTSKRKFIVADCPGHEQYTRNMATGASMADLAVVLVDASKGLLPQTQRHTYILSLMGIKRVVLAINKMDLVDYSAETFQYISSKYAELASKIGIESVQAIPVSALKGDNITTISDKMDFYYGPSLLEYLENVEITHGTTENGFCLPVQYINRLSTDQRSIAGTVVTGKANIGEKIVVLPSGRTSKITGIYNGDKHVESVKVGDAVVIALNDQIDISRGDMIIAGHRPMITDTVCTDLIWLDDTVTLPRRQYWLKINYKTVTAEITRIHHVIDVNTQEKLLADKLQLNDIAECTIATNEPVIFEPYGKNRKLGAFILIDKQTNNTVAAGMIKHTIGKPNNLHKQILSIDKKARADAKKQSTKVLWLTGISGAGKSTIANIVEQKLYANGRHTYILDGDNIRYGLSKDLGFSDFDRAENIRRVAEVAKLMTDAGLIVIVSFISPFKAERQVARKMFDDGEFIEIFLDVPLSVAEKRDPKGLYRKARSGKIRNFTGIDSPYEPPDNPELTFRTDKISAVEIANSILMKLQL